MSVGREISENVMWTLLGLAVAALAGFFVFQMRARHVESIKACAEACASVGGVRRGSSSYCECEGAR